MSTIRLLKDHPRGKKGSEVSVPFSLGKELIANGFGEYAAGNPPTPPVPTIPTERHVADLHRVNEHHARAVADLKAQHADDLAKLREEHEKVVAAVRAELDAAQKQVTELQAAAKTPAKK